MAISKLSCSILPSFQDFLNLKYKLPDFLLLIVQFLSFKMASFHSSFTNCIPIALFWKRNQAKSKQYRNEGQTKNIDQSGNKFRQLRSRKLSREYKYQHDNKASYAQSPKYDCVNFKWIQQSTLKSKITWIFKLLNYR